MSLIQVTAWPDTVPQVVSAISGVANVEPSGIAGDTVESDGTIVMNVGPGRYLIDSASAECGAALQPLVPSHIGTVTDLSHSRVCVHIAGPRVGSLFSRAFALDLDCARLPTHFVVQIPANHVGVLLRRVQDAAFDLYVYRGYAEWFIQWLESLDRPPID